MGNVVEHLSSLLHFQELQAKASELPPLSNWQDEECLQGEEWLQKFPCEGVEVIFNHITGEVKSVSQEAIAMPKPKAPAPVLGSSYAPKAAAPTLDNPAICKQPPPTLPSSGG